MLEAQPYKNFFSDRHFNEGVRLTIGIALPALIGAWFGHLDIGIVVSLGALCVSVVDSPGPIHHRTNGMAFTLLLITVLSIVTAYVAKSELLLGAFIVVSGFLFSMLTVYGDRVSSIGIAALLIIVLSFQSPVTDRDIFLNGLYIFIGGLWYLLLSLVLHTLRPYLIIRQVLGDYIIDVANYFRSRAGFYGESPQFDKIYENIFEQQVNVQNQQTLLSELLFKTRTIVKESTNTSRRLLKIYLDVTELFESIMTSHEDYRVLHKNFYHTGIITEFQKHILDLCNELEKIGINIKSGFESAPNDMLTEQMEGLKKKFEAIRVATINDENVEQFVGFGRIVTNLQHLTEQIGILPYYTNIERKFRREGEAIIHARSMERQRINPDLFFDNFTYKSNLFRHSVRVALALLLGYYISLVMHFTHNAWILLTIIVILKPAYQLSKKRNIDRLFGTFLGILIGAGLIYFIKSTPVLLTMLVLLMVIAYSFLRTNYFISVLAMTPYLVIFYHFLYPHTIEVVVIERMVDTLIGSGIAFIASLFIVPAWEHENIKMQMMVMLDASVDYFSLVSKAFSSNEEVNQSKLVHARKEMFVALANITGSFNRMLSEPKRFRKGIKSVHKFAVLCHILSSHIATLVFYKYVRRYSFKSQAVVPVINNTIAHLKNAKCYISNGDCEYIPVEATATEKMNSYSEKLLEQRRIELQEGKLETDTKKELIHYKSVSDQFNYINSVAEDISKVCREVEEEI